MKRCERWIRRLSFKLLQQPFLGQMWLLEIRYLSTSSMRDWMLFPSIEYVHGHSLTCHKHPFLSLLSRSIIIIIISSSSSPAPTPTPPPFHSIPIHQRHPSQSHHHPKQALPERFRFLLALNRNGPILQPAESSQEAARGYMNRIAEILGVANVAARRWRFHVCYQGARGTEDA